jgi:hypothetical protein
VPKAFLTHTAHSINLPASSPTRIGLRGGCGLRPAAREPDSCDLEEEFAVTLAQTFRASAVGYATRAKSSDNLDRAFFEGIEKSCLALAALMRRAGARRAPQ